MHISLGITLPLLSPVAVSSKVSVQSLKFQVYFTKKWIAEILVYDQPMCVQIPSNLAENCNHENNLWARNNIV
jgi:hypothetical protein